MTKGWAMGCGFALGTVGIKVLKSKLARKGYPYAVAGAMLVRDWVMEESERIQAGASDIADQAKEITERYYEKLDQEYEEANGVTD